MSDCYAYIVDDRAVLFEYTFAVFEKFKLQYSVVGDIIIMRENSTELVGLEDLELLRIQSQMSALWDMLNELQEVEE